MPAYEEEIEEALQRRHRAADAGRPAAHPRRGRPGDRHRDDAHAAGRRRRERPAEPVPIEGSEFVVECDMVLPAVGQVPSSAEAAGALELSRGGTVAATRSRWRPRAKGVFAGGDVVNGGGSVIEAIADGQRAAVAIDRYLGGNGALPPDVTISMYGASPRRTWSRRRRGWRSRCCPSRSGWAASARWSGIVAGRGLRRGRALPALRPGEATVLSPSSSWEHHEQFRLNIDGREVVGQEGPDDPPGGAGERDRHPAPLLRPAPDAHRRLPPLPGRDRGQKPACTPPARAWPSPG